MINAKTIDEIATKLQSAIPPGAKGFQDDMHAQFKQVLQSMLSKLDLVTREEFDAQSKVLARTREKLESLEKAVAEIESNLAANASKDKGLETKDLESKHIENKE